MTTEKMLRNVILLLAILLNLAIANAAHAAWRNSLCIDPETGDSVPCCVWCIFFCDCDYQP